MSRDTILEYFTAFGDVNAVKIHNETICSYGFVKFTLAESAAKGLGVDSHIIGGLRVKIVAASDRHQDKITLLSLNDQKTEFLNLNDDCIQKILSMKCLTAMDLCSVAETCRRLKDIATREFRREHKECDIRSLSKSDINAAQRILKHFGSEIRQLKILTARYSVEWPREILTSVTEHCTNNLQSLHLSGFGIPQDFTAKLKSLFKNLQKLTMEECAFAGASEESFADCGSLVELRIRGCRDVIPFILVNTFTKLQQFECNEREGSDSLESFISRHMNLQSLQISCALGSSVLRRIAECKRLETLGCWISKDANATLDLSSFGHLRELTIDCSRRNVSVIAPGLKQLKCLEQLKFFRAEIDSGFVRTLSQLERLRVLKLWHCTGLHSLNRIDYLSQLKELDIISSEPIDLDIVLVVHRLNQLNFLTVSVPGFRMELKLYLRVVKVLGHRLDRSKLSFRLARFGFNYTHLRDDFARNAHVVEMIIVS